MEDSGTRKVTPGRVVMALVLLGIIAYFGSIGYRNEKARMQETNVRSKYSGVRSELRGLSQAIQKYRADHGAFPAWSRDSAGSAMGIGAGSRSSGPRRDVPSFRLRGATQLATLTTPNAYLQEYPTEQFTRPHDPRPYCYYNDGGAWVMWSTGPDRDYDLPWEQLDAAAKENMAPFMRFTYDPTNGTISSGDIWITGP